MAQIRFGDAPSDERRGRTAVAVFAPVDEPRDPVVDQPRRGHLQQRLRQVHGSPPVHARDATTGRRTGNGRAAARDVGAVEPVRDRGGHRSDGARPRTATVRSLAARTAWSAPSGT